MAVTEHLGLELPDEAKNIDEEFYNLQLLVLPKIDQAIHLLSEALALKAQADHDHGIDDIEELRTVLDGKMSSGVRFALAGLSDVEGVVEAPNGYILVKVGEKMIAQAALSALGDHEHPIAKVLGLEEALETIAEAINTRAEAIAVGVALGEKLAKDASNVGDATAQAAFRAAIGAISEEDVPPVDNLDAGAITTGTFDPARIPNLDASKIAAGTLPVARGGTGQTTEAGMRGAYTGNSAAFTNYPIGAYLLSRKAGSGPANQENRNSGTTPNPTAAGTWANRGFAFTGSGESTIYFNLQQRIA